MVKEIADWMVKQGTEDTFTGNYFVYSEEIARQFCVSEQWIAEHQDEICEAVDSHEEILSETWISTTDGIIVFDMNFGTNYCPNYEEDEE